MSGSYSMTHIQSLEYEINCYKDFRADVSIDDIQLRSRKCQIFPTRMMDTGPTLDPKTWKPLGTTEAANIIAPTKARVSYSFNCLPKKLMETQLAILVFLP